METFQRISLAKIAPDPRQPRRYFDPEKLADLAESIKVNGVIQPIKVRPNPDAGAGKPDFMIISGERRWRASGLADQPDIPAVIEDDELSAGRLYAQQLAENLDREDLNPVEKAEAIQARIDELKGQGIQNAVEQVAGELGKSVSWVSKNTQILKYSPEVRQLVHSGKIKDYELVKKVDSLKGDKRDQAISLIESGEFNGKEFFARTRYDKKPKTDAVSHTKNDEDGEDKEPIKAGATEKKNKFKLELSPQGLIKLIDKTDFRHVLDRQDEDWRGSPVPILKVHFESFTKWLLETED